VVARLEDSEVIPAIRRRRRRRYHHAVTGAMTEELSRLAAAMIAGTEAVAK
jgi:hypothetical protein